MGRKANRLIGMAVDHHGRYGGATTAASDRNDGTNGVFTDSDQVIDKKGAVAEAMDKDALGIDAIDLPSRPDHLVKEFKVTGRVVGVPGSSQRVGIDKDRLVSSHGFDVGPFMISAWRGSVESEAMIADDENMLRQVTVFAVNDPDKAPLMITDSDRDRLDARIGAQRLTSRAATHRLLLGRRNRLPRCEHGWRLYTLGITSATRRGRRLPLISRLDTHA